jgi:plastocyanin
MGVRSLILAAGALAAVACFDSGNDVQGPGDQPPEGDILVRNNFFDPPALEVAPGATVVWAWASSGTVHNILFDDAVTSGEKGSGTFERTFAAEGNFPYHCTIHAGMTGVVNVVAAPSPGDGGGGGGGGGGYPYGDPGGY